MTLLQTLTANNPFRAHTDQRDRRTALQPGRCDAPWRPHDATAGGLASADLPRHADLPVLAIPPVLQVKDAMAYADIDVDVTGVARHPVPPARRRRARQSEGRRHRL